MRRLNQSPLSPSDICVLAAHIVASLSQVYLTITSVHFPANQKVLGGTSISLSLSLSLSPYVCVCARSGSVSAFGPLPIVFSSRLRVCLCVNVCLSLCECGHSYIVSCCVLPWGHSMFHLFCSFEW